MTTPFPHVCGSPTSRPSVRAKLNIIFGLGVVLTGYIKFRRALPLIEGFWNGKSWNVSKTSKSTNQDFTYCHDYFHVSRVLKFHATGFFTHWYNARSATLTISTAVMLIFYCILVACSHGSFAKVQCLDHAVPAEQRLNITLDGLLGYDTKKDWGGLS